MCSVEMHPLLSTFPVVEVLAHVPLQTFLNFDAMFMLIELVGPSALCAGTVTVTPDLASGKIPQYTGAR